MEIKTNNQERNLIYGYELSAKERAEFDCIAPEDFDAHNFVRYRGRVYDVSEFMRCGESLAGWHGYASDSYFSGVVIRLSPDGERAVMGTYFS